MGVPRSGTRLLSRILGRASGVCLLTEHSNRFAPQEQATPIGDHVFWHRAFPNMASESGPFDQDGFQRLIEQWLAFADGRRLILKNPQNLCRVSAIQKAFPDALFVWLIRDPWATIQSMILSKRNGAMLLRSDSILGLPEDVLLRSAESWAVGAEQVSEPMVRYENLVADPVSEIQRLCSHLGLAGALENGAANLPIKRRQDFGFMRYVLRRSCYRDRALARIKPLADRLNYPDFPPGWLGDTYWLGARYAVQWLRHPKQRPPYGFPKLEKLRKRLR